ncbi:hypothetical protein C0J52_02473 [Blattella germanica]|nr:hypothetical protein C0J52_02473 [Blattella germanica]
MDFFKTQILNNNITVIEEMISSGLDVNLQDQEGITPLQMAAAYGNNRIIELLIFNNAEIDKANNIGWTPLMHAVRNGHSSAVKILLRHGANINLRNGMGASVHSLAVASGNYLTVEHIMTAIPLQEEKDCPITPLTASIICEHYHLVEFLLQFYDPGASLPETGMTALMMSALKGEHALIQQMVYHGAGLNKQNILGQTAIDIAQIKHNLQLRQIIKENEINEWKAFIASRQNESPSVETCEREYDEHVQMFALTQSKYSFITNPVSQNSHNNLFPSCPESSELHNRSFGRDSNDYFYNKNTINSTTDSSSLNQVEKIPQHECQNLYLAHQNDEERYGECNNLSNFLSYKPMDKQMSRCVNGRETCSNNKTQPPWYCNKGDHFSAREIYHNHLPARKCIHQSSDKLKISNSLLNKNKSYNASPISRGKDCTSEHFLQQVTFSSYPSNQNCFSEQKEIILPENNCSIKASQNNKLKSDSIKEFFPEPSPKRNDIQQESGPFYSEIDKLTNDQCKSIYFQNSENCSTLEKQNVSRGYNRNEILSGTQSSLSQSNNSLNELKNVQQRNVSKAPCVEKFFEREHLSPRKLPDLPNSMELFSSIASDNKHMHQRSHEEHSPKKHVTGNIKDTSEEVSNNKKSITTVHFTYNPAEPLSPIKNPISHTIHITHYNDSSNKDHAIHSPTVSISCDSNQSLSSNCRAISPNIYISYDNNTDRIYSPEYKSSTPTICISHNLHEPQNVEIKLPSPIKPTSFDIKLLYSPERDLACPPTKVYPNKNKLLVSPIRLSNQMLIKKKSSELQGSYSPQTRLFSVNTVEPSEEFTFEDSYNKIKRSNSI